MNELEISTSWHSYPKSFALGPRRLHENFGGTEHVSDKSKLEIFATSVAGKNTQSVTLESIIGTVSKIQDSYATKLGDIFTGIKVIPDEIGVFCHPEGYAIIMGKKLYERMNRKELK